MSCGAIVGSNSCPSADFYSMFFLYKNWIQQTSEQREDVQLSNSLEARYQAFVKAKQASLSNLAPRVLVGGASGSGAPVVTLSPTTGQPTMPKYPHLAFPVSQLRMGEVLDTAALRDGVVTTRAVWECLSNDGSKSRIFSRDVLVRSHRLNFVRSDVSALHGLVEQMRLMQW